jgi:hypothetical protein
MNVNQRFSIHDAIVCLLTEHNSGIKMHGEGDRLLVAQRFCIS